ncbi:MAG: BCCT family transporter [Anaeromicrobium sp.]|jgi:glycine betaine transporter|uniref:BCCT family transporter n=1 Tax=Anaeromicrobium sp. TaxID=1929132 RepID=UPI0025DCD4F0|nr:BCCT family transporter [Anaeromicrobium sp.]MCT4594415.1 BCCT family transporter [Anaeromicrobium sp.]
MKNNKVYIWSLVIVIGITLWGLLSPGTFEIAATGAFNVLVGKFGWLYLISMFSFVLFCIWIGFSKYGNIKLGKDDDEPEFAYATWFAMLFSAGMGIGLVFWGVAEPLNHYVNPLNLTGGTQAAADFAIKKSFFHWGLHPWANYSVLAMALAYMQFRKDKPGLISSVFIPLIGEKGAKGPIGQAVDVMAVFATAAGIATSLGLGTLQINSGLNYVFGLAENQTVQTAIIGIITVIVVYTAVSGVEKGIKWICNANLVIAAGLVVVALFIGPTIEIINTFVNGLGLYLGDFLRDSLYVSSDSWFGSWTIFYWAWWIAWAPFVGTFIARISKGRTIKEFVLGVMLVPALGSFLWFSIFGTMGMHLGLDVATEAIKSTSTAFFVVIGHYPLGRIISVIAVTLLCTFFITSANSATFVLGMFSSDGDLDPSNGKKIVWGILQSVMALALLLAGGLGMLQTASIAAAFPFIFIMIFAMVSLVKALKEETVIIKEDK